MVVTKQIITVVLLCMTSWLLTSSEGGSHAGPSSHPVLLLIKMKAKLKLKLNVQFLIHSKFVLIT